MPKESKPGRPTTRRYSGEEKAQAVRLVRHLRKELGTSHGVVQRVANRKVSRPTNFGRPPSVRVMTSAGTRSPG